MNVGISTNLGDEIMKIEDIIENLYYIQKSEKKYGRLWTVCEESIKALEKQIPKELIDNSKNKMTWLSYCTACNKELPYVVWNNNLEYCPNCGQKLKW